MKITLRQGLNGNKDPVLYVEVTTHPSYLKDRLIFETVDEALQKIKAWLERRTDDN